MAPDHDPKDAARPECSQADCPEAADFWRYEAPTGSWRPVCTRHARHAHPSLELGAWLESGYATPVEVGRPAGPPAEPSTGRAAAFRDLVAAAMGWSAEEG